MKTQFKVTPNWPHRTAVLSAVAPLLMLLPIGSDRIEHTLGAAAGPTNALLKDLRTAARVEDFAKVSDAAGKLLEAVERR